MEEFTTLQSPFILLDVANVDTDQIIPARFLKQIHRGGLGASLFYDWRYNADGTQKESQVLNQRANEGVSILVAGPNFACGSSREHAVWALHDYGFRVILSPSISDIFRSNALKNGLLPIEISESFYRRLIEHPDGEVTVDLEALEVSQAGGPRFAFRLEPFARLCLLKGTDQLGYLLNLGPEIEAYEQRRLA